MVSAISLIKSSASLSSYNVSVTKITPYDHDAIP